ncbi:MAG TPA: hypothetical protein VFI61_01825 [Patescibacteria group bacterium]|nr:hypothetical protein [Patescibacteria group bacterium]
MNNNFQILTLDKKGITDFGSERNNLLSSSKSEWVMFLDSDEKIVSFDLPSNNKFSCYQFIRKNYFLGQYVGSDKIIRLIKKGTGKWVRRVHEVWKPASGPVGKINTPIIHNTADSLHDYISKMNFYSDLHAKANKEEGKRSDLFKIIFYPVGKFIVTFIKSKNMVFSIMQSFHSFLAWSELWILQKG